MITLTYLDQRRLWVNGLTVRGVCRYQTLVMLLTDAGPYWFRLADFDAATLQPGIVRLAPLGRQQATAELAHHLMLIDGWAESNDLYAGN
jgi:hypothetical protein